MEHLETTLKALRDELVMLEGKCSRLATELAETQERKGKVKSGIMSISRLLDEKKASEIMQEIGKAPANLTDAVREVFKSATGRLTPADIRDALVEMGYNVTQHTNMLASIHTCLKRLTSVGEIERYDTYNPGDKPRYELKRELS
jgi:hypothetical protein